MYCTEAKKSTNICLPLGGAKEAGMKSEHNWPYKTRQKSDSLY